MNTPLDRMFGADPQNFTPQEEEEVFRELARAFTHVERRQACPEHRRILEMINKKLETRDEN